MSGRMGDATPTLRAPQAQRHRPVSSALPPAGDEGRPGRPAALTEPIRHRRSLSSAPPLLSRWLAAAILLVLSLSLLVSSAGLDAFLNRGIVYGVPEAGASAGGLSLGMNVFLEKEARPENVVTSVQMLKDAHVTFVRQSFPWAEIEPDPGVYVDPKTGQNTWAKYDFIVGQLAGAGIGILARVDTIPRWARPPDDDFKQWDKGPPQDFNNYANFVARLAERYKGKIAHFQVWNEPNLTGEWGGKPISPQQYGLLLKFTWTKVKAVNPNALIVTAGLAQTIEDGVRTNNLNELDFIQGLYDAHMNQYFDILSVMAYGLGTSPGDRRVGPERTNFSRLQLAREIMVRNGDAAKPIWASEYGWLSLPPDWTGERGTWGNSVDEETQARWTIAGLDRARVEWPWLGAVFVWAFRWVEPPSERPSDPARYFEVVDHDFRPRPAYLALRDWAGTQQIASSGIHPVRDPRITWRGDWRDQTLGRQDYRVSSSPNATMRVVFHGTDLRLRARVGPADGHLYATLDGQPIPGLAADSDGSYLLLREAQTDTAEITLATGLRDGEHLLELRPGGDGQVSLNGIAVGRRRAFNWTTELLFAAGLAGIFAGLVVAGQAALGALNGMATFRSSVARRRPPWRDPRE